MKYQTATFRYNRVLPGSAQIKLAGNQVHFTLPLSVVKLWGAGQPNLNDLKLAMIHPTGAVDQVDSYFGLRLIYLKSQWGLGSTERGCMRKCSLEGVERDYNHPAIIGW
jgi:hypothetical protein